MSEPAGNSERTRRAFTLAAKLERAASLQFERAAELHEVLAAEFERAARAEPQPVQSERLSRRAGVERHLARLTRQRARREQTGLAAD